MANHPSLSAAPLTRLVSPASPPRHRLR
ncbi:winged helix family transcriptional regulator, partial [Streptomyces sp. SID8380]|nr:winged helix family transcriptional regulator [Streptomyces sp. SID8380]